MTYKVVSKKTGAELGTVDEQGKQAYLNDPFSANLYKYIPTTETAPAKPTPPEAKKPAEPAKEKA